MTILHGIIVTSMAFVSVFIIGPWPLSHLGQQPNQGIHVIIIIASAGYFFFDLFWYMWYRSERRIILAHHMLSLFGLVYVYYTDIYGCEVVAGLGAFEVFAVFSLAERLLDRTCLRNYPMILKFVYVVVFILIRIVAGSLFCWYFLSNPSVNFIPKVAVVIFHAMNFQYAWRIIKENLLF